MVCSSGRWKGERELCYVGNRVYLLLTVEVQSRSEQRLLMPFIPFSKPLVFFFFFFLLWLFFLFSFSFSPCMVVTFVFMFIFSLRREESIGKGGAFYYFLIICIYFHLSREGSIGRGEH